MLDYARTRSPSSRRTVGIVLATVALAGLVLVGLRVPALVQRWQAARRANAYRFVDSEISGTQVYFRDKFLGTTPLILSKAECQALGLPVTAGTSVDSDGWGEGLFFHAPTGSVDPRLMFKVPSARASEYLQYETPWGTRTKMAGGWGLANGFRSRFMRYDANGGLVVTINFDSAAASADRPIAVQVTVTNRGTQPVVGHRPDIELHWGTLDTQWQDRAHQTFTLPVGWATVQPGQSLQTIIQMPRPRAAGDYSVFATFDLFADETSPYLAGHGSVYSDSKLLRVP